MLAAGSQRATRVGYKNIPKDSKQGFGQSAGSRQWVGGLFTSVYTAGCVLQAKLLCARAIRPRTATGRA